MACRETFGADDVNAQRREGAFGERIELTVVDDLPIRKTN